MKIFVIALVMMLGIGMAIQAQKPKSDKETVIFDVSMTCENCQKRIEKNIAFEKGVTDMKVDLANKTVQVEYKPSQTTVEKLQAAIVKLGYEVKIHGKEQKTE
ncbi:MAG: heavy-metal-associated domain-containing protein [Prevotella sp.]|jgi:copper chaperone CopZ|nr:heavy-metal-associated domain-containing protein [Prevotella sp.]